MGTVDSCPSRWAGWRPCQGKVGPVAMVVVSVAVVGTKAVGWMAVVGWWWRVVPQVPVAVKGKLWAAASGYCAHHPSTVAPRPTLNEPT